MSDLLSRFKTHAAALDILPGAEERILLAVSGGADSMVLLHLCHKLDISCAVAHCNFQLRGEESDGDEAFVQDRAGEWEIPFYSQHFDTLSYADSTGDSVQVAARDLRYEWFLTLCGQLNISKMATAHHLNDHAETAMINWVRGTGIDGLSGIPAVTSRGNGRLKVLRPLLPFTKKEMLEYASENAITWREDSSNAKDNYTRNFIRRRIMPLLEEAHPGFLHTFERSAAYLSETSANYRFLLQQSAGFRPFRENTFQLDIATLKQLPSPSAALRELLKPYGFGREQARQAATSLDKTGFDIHSNTGNRLTVDRNKLLLELAVDPSASRPELLITTNDLMVRLSEGNRLFFTPAAAGAILSDGKEAVIVDAGKLEYPLRLRNWQAGDIFQPFGMEGKSRKVQDFLTDLKLSKPDKERTMMLINGDGAIIWVVGYRLDHRFKIEATTENFLKISCIRLI